MRKNLRHREKKKSRDRQSKARNRSSHACLPKRTTLTAREGEGRSLHRQKAGRVGAGVTAKGFLSLVLTRLAVLFSSFNPKTVFSAIFKEEITQCTVKVSPTYAHYYYIIHLIRQLRSEIKCHNFSPLRTTDI